MAEDGRRRRLSQSTWSQADVEQYLGQSARSAQEKREQGQANKVSAEIMPTPRAQEEVADTLPPGFQLSKKWVSDMYFKRQVRKVKFNEENRRSGKEEEEEEEEDLKASGGRLMAKSDEGREGEGRGGEGREEGGGNQEAESSGDVSLYSESEGRLSSNGSADDHSEGEERGEEQESEQEEQDGRNQRGGRGEQGEADDEEEEDAAWEGERGADKVDQMRREGSSSQEPRQEDSALSFSAGTWSRGSDRWQLRTLKEKQQGEQEETVVDYGVFLRWMNHRDTQVPLHPSGLQQTAQVKIPQTCFFLEGVTIAWYFTSATTNDVRKKKRVNLRKKNVLDAFCKVNEFMLVVVVVVLVVLVVVVVVLVVVVVVVLLLVVVLVVVVTFDGSLAWNVQHLTKAQLSPFLQKIDTEK
ncbi:hypothetical protein GUITHDRAFT_137980, partial [Guillardia theta CCMP2712]